MIKRILNQFMNKIHTYDTSIDENYFRIPRYLFYEAIEELEEGLKGKEDIVLNESRNCKQCKHYKGCIYLQYMDKNSHQDPCGYFEL